MITHLHHWRLIYIDHSMLLVARAAVGRPTKWLRPHITGPIVSGTIAEGEVVQTQRGTSYELGEPLPPAESAEFARTLLLRQASRNRTFDEVQVLDRNLDEILAGSTGC